ncbi:hypothetical protein EV363DRAFT_1398849 [Boletus edulis]|nr:hypothetical protein EV363DRAFT_1398849 [Boletus edulis]
MKIYYPIVAGVVVMTASVGSCAPSYLHYRPHAVLMKLLLRLVVSCSSHGDVRVQAYLILIA